MSKILFSPVGSTDPIANQKDGALLHIARVYKPDIIYLYLSKEMCELAEQDNRYVFCLEKLEEKINKQFDIRIINKSDLVDVHHFDFFVNEFENILEDIKENSDDEILVNVSSGTPAMKSALQTLSTISNDKILPIQVYTPKKAYNDEREDVKGDYLVDVQWECNIDNEEEFQNRCFISSNINMGYKIKREILIKLLRAYDYVSAVSIAESISSDFITEDALRLLNIAKYRAMLDRNTCSRLASKESFDIFPEKSSDKQSIVEYLLYMQLKLKKEEYIEFMRAMSPVFYNILEKLIKEYYQFDISKYCYENKQLNGVVLKRWKEEIANKEKIIVETCSNRDNKVFGNVETRQLVELIKKLDRENNNIIKIILELRETEFKIRNPLAHGITYINNDIIKKETGLTIEQIFKKFCALAKYAQIKMDDETLNSYDKLNDEIIARL